MAQPHQNDIKNRLLTALTEDAFSLVQPNIFSL